MPPKETPEAVTRKVIAAASRESGAWKADIAEDEKAPTSASPATASIRIEGASATKAVTALGEQPENDITDAKRSVTPNSAASDRHGRPVRRTLPR